MEGKKLRVVELFDFKTNKPYYFDSSSVQSSWRKEDFNNDSENQDEIITFKDAKTGRLYQFNKNSFISTWNEQVERDQDNDHSMPQNFEKYANLSPLVITCTDSITGKLYSFDREQLKSTFLEYNSDEGTYIDQEESDAEVETETEEEVEEVVLTPTSLTNNMRECLLEVLLILRAIQRQFFILQEWPSMETFEKAFLFPSSNWRLIMIIHNVLVMNQSQFQEWREELDEIPPRQARIKWLKGIYSLLQKWKKNGEMDESEKPFLQELMSFISLNDKVYPPFRPPQTKEDSRLSYNELSTDLRLRIFFACCSWGYHNKSYFIMNSLVKENASSMRPDILGCDKDGYFYFSFFSIAPFRVFRGIEPKVLEMVSHNITTTIDFIRKKLAEEPPYSSLAVSLRKLGTDLERSQYSIPFVPHVTTFANHPKPQVNGSSGASMVASNGTALENLFFAHLSDRAAPDSPSTDRAAVAHRSIPTPRGTYSNILDGSTFGSQIEPVFPSPSHMHVPSSSSSSLHEYSAFSIPKSRTIDSDLGLGKSMETLDKSGAFHHLATQDTSSIFHHDLYTQDDFRHALPTEMMPELSSQQTGEVKTSIEPLLVEGATSDNPLPTEGLLSPRNSSSSLYSGTPPLVLVNSIVNNIPTQDSSTTSMSSPKYQ